LSFHRFFVFQRELDSIPAALCGHGFLQRQQHQFRLLVAIIMVSCSDASSPQSLVKNAVGLRTESLGVTLFLDGGTQAANYFADFDGLGHQ